MSEIFTLEGDHRPIWVVAREWYERVATELEEIAKTGGVRTPRGMLAVSEKAQRRALKQAKLFRRAAALVEAERPQYEAVPALKEAA